MLFLHGHVVKPLVMSIIAKKRDSPNCCCKSDIKGSGIDQERNWEPDVSSRRPNDTHLASALEQGKQAKTKGTYYDRFDLLHQTLNKLCYDLLFLKQRAYRVSS